jgi:putative methionine-R-sulfoxide reductase with GAF domain
MTGEHAGGRVLVVVSSTVSENDREGDSGSDAERRPDADDPDDTFYRGGGGTKSETGASPVGPDGGTDATGPSPGRPGSNGPSNADGGQDDDCDVDCDCNPEAVIAELDRQLPVDVVSRCSATAVEYVDELGPTLDCVVILGADPPLIRELATGKSIPTVVYDPPVVSVVDGTLTGEDYGELIERVRGEVWSDRSKSELRESNARLTALSHYAEDITACETIEAVLDRTIEAAVEALAFDHSIVFLTEGDRLVPRASVLPEPEASPSNIDAGIAGRTLAAGESEIVDDMQTDPDAIPEHDGLHAVLSVPIGTLGVIQMASKECGAFDERDREFVEILAGYTREALERIEREVTLRKERDRLHAFFGDLPVPAVYVERRDDVITVEEVNYAYASQFGDPETGKSLLDAVQSDTEFEQYQTALRTGAVTTDTVERSVEDGPSRTFSLSVIPVSPPGIRECSYGIYVGADGEIPMLGPS